MEPLDIYTIGHSTLALADFVRLLRSHGVKQVVDIRTIPRSRHNPQFNMDTFGPHLRRHNLGYRHEKALGGLRHTRPDSPNVGWENASFRGFADYMLTPDFEVALTRLLEIAASRTTCLMCAEAVPWRCHRSLVADALTVRGVRVLDIMSADHVTSHTLTPWAHVEGTRITYPRPLSPEE
jgi:uncharacterized protein (DUF488 family)